MAETFAVVLGLSPTGLYAVRELGEAGIAVLGVDSSRQAGCYSRHLTVDPGYLIDRDENGTVERLIAVSELRGARGVLIATSDIYIEFIARNASRLSARYDFQESYSRESFAEIVDKGRFRELCRAHGVSAPSSWVSEGSELAGLAGQVDFPCLIKPTLIHRVKDFMAGRKVFIAQDIEEFRLIAQKIGELAGSWLVQEIIPGPESNITLFYAYFAKDGSVQQAFTGRKLRQYPPGFGSASLVRSEKADEARLVSERFLKAAGFRGIAGVEFKLDERDGKLKIIEVNPRPVFFASLSHHAEKRIALAAFNDLAGRAAVPEKEQRDGILWRDFLKDRFSSLFYVINGREFVLASPDVAGANGTVKTVGPILDRSDLRPIYGAFVNYATKFIARVIR